MKKIWIILLFSLGILGSCNEFLDVTADNEILEEQLFNDIQGVRMSVNGVYRTLSSTTLYGQNLTWGFASAIGHNYECSSLNSLPESLYRATLFEWKYAAVEGLTDQIWRTAYNVISSCNNIIQHVSVKNNSFFEAGEDEKNMILGEMYAIRAMLHFDLYRLFAPAPVTNYTGLTIPYVEKYPDQQPEHKTGKEVMSLIIGDMEQAKTLLAQDTLNRSAANDFMDSRANRMNFWGATGLLARIYLYNGNDAKAYENAMINYASEKHGWTAAANQGLQTSIETVYPKRPDEIFTSFYNRYNYDNWEAALSTSSVYFRMKNMADLFKGDEDDFRLIGWYNRYGDARYLTWVRPVSTSAASDVIAERQGPLLPIVCLPEMYHILIECLINQGKTVEAAELLNTLRLNRGAKALISENDDLKTILMKDFIRETLTSGQTFFWFKRLNQNIYNGTANIVMDASKWTIPLPQSETAYQH